MEQELADHVQPRNFCWFLADLFATIERGERQAERVGAENSVTPLTCAFAGCAWR